MPVQYANEFPIERDFLALLDARARDAEKQAHNARLAAEIARENLNQKLQGPRTYRTLQRPVRTRQYPYSQAPNQHQNKRPIPDKHGGDQVVSMNRTESQVHSEQQARIAVWKSGGFSNKVIAKEKRRQDKK